MSEDIPLEIQAEILKRLPIKPLIQFRSVSNLWKSKSESKQVKLIAIGLGFYQQTDRNRVRVCILSNQNHQKKDKDRRPKCCRLLERVPVLIPYLAESKRERISRFKQSGCHTDNRNGIEMVVLWNPSIRKSVGVQVPNLYDSPNEILRITRDIDVIGFGVCPATLDPTVLWIKWIGYIQKKNGMPGFIYSIN